MFELILHFFLNVAHETQLAKEKAERQFIAHLERIAVHRLVLKKADAENDQSAEVFALLRLGEEHADAQEWDAAITMYQRALFVAREIGNDDWQVAALLKIGSVYAHQQEFDNSHKYYKQALETARKAGKKDLETIVLKQIDNLYYTIKADELSKITR